MSLRGRISGGLMVLALVSVGAPAVLQWWVLNRQVDLLEQRAFADLSATLEGRWSGLGWLVGRQVAGIVESVQGEPEAVTGLALDAAAAAPSVLESARGLDVLWLLDESGKILAAPHWPARSGQSVPVLAALEPGQPVVLRPAVRNEKWMVVAVAEILPLPGRRLRVVGGLRLDEAVRGALSPDDSVGLALFDAAGDLLAARPWPLPLPGLDRLAREDGTGRALSLVGVQGEPYRVVIHPLAGQGDRLGALVAWRPMTEVSLLRGGIAGVALIAGVAALCALAGGLWLARQVTRPVQELTEVVGRMAAGELDQEIPVRTRDEVGRLTRAFNSMAAAIRRGRAELADSERRAAWRDAARQMAHEVKNPLAPIRLSVENLRRARTGAPAEVFDRHFDTECRTITEEVDALARLVDEFSRFARLPPPQIRPADADALIRHVAELYRGTEGVDVGCALEGALPGFSFDPELIGQVLKNLVANAVDAVPRPGGKVTLVGRTENGHVVIEVRDNGPGLPEGPVERLFEPYVTGKIHGSGLGLAISREIVESHRGRIEAEDGPDGAVFRIRLPLE